MIVNNTYAQRIAQGIQEAFPEMDVVIKDTACLDDDIIAVSINDNTIDIHIDANIYTKDEPESSVIRWVKEAVNEEKQ